MSAKMRELTKKEKAARERLCLSLDGLNTVEEIRDIVQELGPVVGLFKIGNETFTRFGLDSVNIVHAYGGKVFLDLKFHDIPTTVKGAARAASELDVFMFNIHTSGGLEMMNAAKEGILEAKKMGFKSPKVIGVTILTSIDENIMNKEIGISGKVEKQVLRLAKLAEKAGLDGIVCSAAELKKIKGKLPKEFIYVTPGIKGPETKAGYDQKRVYSPYNAIKDGATIVVVGRAITGEKDRQKAALDVLEDMARAL